MNSFNVVALAEHPHHWQTAAEWSFAAWHHEFPSDTVQTYLDQYKLAASKPEKLIEIYAAVLPHLSTTTSYLMHQNLARGWQQSL
jgi:hypothetical protein